jgi:aspartyl-tRNA(Asn)/glutamyl-tRNA(Gln) amidotransferase subunit C
MTPMSDTPSITRDDVAHLARLARIDLAPETLDHYAEQLGVILGAVAQVSEVATDDIPPTSHPLPLVNVFRADTVRPTLTNAEALSGAPSVESERFRVPRILDEE